MTPKKVYGGPSTTRAPSRSSSLASSTSSTSSTSSSEIREILPTRRPPPSETRQQPPPDKNPEPAPEYTAHKLLSPSPPDISEDTTPPHYQINTLPIPPFFQAILEGDETELQRLLSHDPELVNQKDPQDRTPLYRAVIAYNGQIEIVKLLLESGASVNEWSTEVTPQKHWLAHTEPQTQRTALMAASSHNRLPIVRLLLSPPYNADSSLVATDGQHALRLASAAGAREIVQLLPSLRAGGWKRVKHRSRDHVEVIKKTGKKMYKVGKVVVWHIPKFFLYHVPKEILACFWEIIKAIGKGMAKGMKATWEGMKKLPGAVQRFSVWLPGAVWAVIKGTPGALQLVTMKIWTAIKAFAKWIWEAVTVELPRATVQVLKFLVRVVKWLWKFLTVTFPKYTVKAVKLFWEIVKGLSKWIWNIITVRVPKVSVMVYRAIIDALGIAWETFVKMVMALASLAHTFVSFLLRKCTLANLVQGAKHTFNFIFVSIPQTIWKGLEGTYKLCYKVVKGLFGCLGWFFWNLGECLVAGAMWFPAMIGKILLSCGKILAGALKEVRLWVNPKADV